MSRWKIACLALAFALPAAPAVVAQPAVLPENAQTALNKGLAAANAQQWETAIQNFQDARKIAPNAPEIDYDLGLAESKIPGRELRAVAWLAAYLAAAPNAPNAAAVKNLIAELQIKTQGNIDRLIRAVDTADGLLPDTPITHNGGITGKMTNKPDQDRIMSLFEVANLWASSGKSAEAVEVAHRIGKAGYNETYSLSQIVGAQAGAGYIADAIKTAASFNDVVWSEGAKLAIAEAQAKAGDLASARATLTTAQQTASGQKSVYIKNSQALDITRAQANVGDISGSQKTAQMIPSPFSRSWAQVAIAEAQAKAGDVTGARASLASAQKAAELWGSAPAAQKKALCNCALSEPQDQSSLASLEYRIGKLLGESGEGAGARSALRVAQKYTRLMPAAQKSYQASQIVEAQANVGDFAGAQETAKLIAEAMWKGNAAMSLAEAQAKAGDFAGAQKTAELSGDSSIVSRTKYIVTQEQAKRSAATQAAASDPAASPKSAPPIPANPAIAVSDWIVELDALNSPLFTDLPGSVRAPQQTYKTIYPGSSIDPSETDTKRTFKALAAIAQNIIAARNTIEQMLKRQFPQTAHP
jgi:tetratricopeptide (TPR) repeat protein